MVELTMLSALSRVAYNLLNSGDNKDYAKKGNSATGDSAIANINSRSLLELGQVTEVEAITVIDSALTMHESTTDVLKFANTLYASWYLSAAAVVTDTGRVKTVDLLAKLNPSKSPSYTVANSILSVAEKVAGGAVRGAVGKYGIGYSAESFGADMPKLTVATLPRTGAQMTVALEALEVVSSMEAQAPAPKEPVLEAPGAAKHIGKFQNANDLTAVANLSIGQAVTLQVTDGKASKDVVVNIRLITVPTAPRILSTILKWSDKDMRLKSRISSWRAGELRFWRDVVLMRDVFTERQRLLMDDRSDLFQMLLGRQKNSMINSVLTASPDIGNMSSILVISQDNLRRIEEYELEGSISNTIFRQRVMANTGLVMIIVVDPLSELVTIYKHTSAVPTECSIRQMKSAGKGGASDFSELIKLMNQNKMPSYM